MGRRRVRGRGGQGGHRLRVGRTARLLPAQSRAGSGTVPAGAGPRPRVRGQGTGAPRGRGRVAVKEGVVGMIRAGADRVFLPTKNLLEQVGDMMILTGKTMMSALRPPYPYGTEFVQQFMFAL